jgi:hypothetical protein
LLKSLQHMTIPTTQGRPLSSFLDRPYNLGTDWIIHWSAPIKPDIMV